MNKQDEKMIEELKEEFLQGGVSMTKSNCCNQPMRVEGDTSPLGGTMHYVCNKCNKACSPAPPKPDAVEKLYREYFNGVEDLDEDDLEFIKRTHIIIKQALTKQRKELREKVEGMKKEYRMNPKISSDPQDLLKEIHNDAVDEFIKLLSK